MVIVPVERERIQSRPLLPLVANVIEPALRLPAPTAMVLLKVPAVGALIVTAPLIVNAYVLLIVRVVAFAPAARVSVAPLVATSTVHATLFEITISLNVVLVVPPMLPDAPLKVTVPLPPSNDPPLFVQFVPAMVILFVPAESCPAVSVIVPFTANVLDIATPLTLLIVRLFKAAMLDGIVIPVELPANINDDEADVVKFEGVPTIAGPFSVRVFAPTVNAPLVSVSVPLMVIEPDIETPLELLTVKLLSAATLEGIVTPPELPPNVNEDDEVVLKFAGVPAIAGPFSARVFAPTVNVPFVNVSVLFTVDVDILSVNPEALLSVKL